VLAARHIIAGADTSLYVTQAQDVVEPGLHQAMLARFQEERPDGLIAATRVDTYFPGGYLTLKDGRVTSIVEKPGAGREPSDLVNLVAHVFRSAAALFSALEKVSGAADATDDAYERALSLLMQRERFAAVIYDGSWCALKYPWHVLDVMDLLLERWTAGVESPGAAYEQREPGVFVGRDVRIFPGAYVVAPALLGHGAVLGHGSLVRGSIIGNGSVVGFGSEVARSYLAEHVELHHNYVGDSVLDHGAAMGYGAVTANYRLDSKTVPMLVAGRRFDSGRLKLGAVMGAGARLGVNTSTMPGVKLGPGAIAGPNLRVTRDLPAGARMLTERSHGRS
jgi:NDP-sugar pyrophosphorylase family protein